MIDFVEFRKQLMTRYKVNYFQANMIIRKYHVDINRAGSIDAAIDWIVKTEHIKPKT